jgi:ligand-binding sensor domain-containing protein
VEQGFTEHGAILALAGEGEQIYLGTESGLFLFDTQEETPSPVSGMSGLRINDLLIANQMLYVASDRGLRAVHNGIGAGWLAFGEIVNSLAWVDGELWYGSASGLHRGSGGEDLLMDWEITSVAADPEGTVWADRVGGKPRR